MPPACRTTSRSPRRATRPCSASRIQERFPKYYRYFSTSSFAYRGQRHAQPQPPARQCRGRRRHQDRLHPRLRLQSRDLGQARQSPYRRGGAGRPLRRRARRPHARTDQQTMSPKRRPSATAPCVAEAPKPVERRGRPSRKPQPPPRNAARAARSWRRVASRRRSVPTMSIPAVRPRPITSAAGSRPIAVKLGRPEDMAAEAACRQTASIRPSRSRHRRPEPWQRHWPRSRQRQPIELPAPPPVRRTRRSRSRARPSGSRPAAAPAKGQSSRAMPRQAAAVLRRRVRPPPPQAPASPRTVPVPRPPRAAAGSSRSAPIEDEGEAREHLSSAKSKVRQPVREGRALYRATIKGDKTLYRARFAGFDARSGGGRLQALKREDIASAWR